MKEVILVRYQCEGCFRLYDEKQLAKICEAEHAYGKRHRTKEEWERAEPASGSPPNEKWSAWSAYGLARGW